jgi:molecular chaperone DnaK (HSP70)
VGYHLGIDLGTTYTAAAVERGGRVEAITLGNRQVSVPSVLFLKSDGEVLVGDAANRRGVTEPERLAREFKRRVGDPTPVLLAGTPYGAEALMGKLLRWVVERVVEMEGGPPDAIALTHPANWGTFKLDLLHQAARHANVGIARFLTEPEAAATSYASQERVEPGSIIAVYDLGGGTFDATVLRKRSDGFDILGKPEGIERLGGIDFDVSVFNHVWNSLGGALQGIDVEDPAVLAAVSRLRRECVDAKEALSADTDVSIPVVLPALQTEVRLTRNEFESMIRPALGETVVALHRALQGAGVTPEQVSAVLLVGRRASRWCRSCWRASWAAPSPSMPTRRMPCAWGRPSPPPRRWGRRRPSRSPRLRRLLPPRPLPPQRRPRCRWRRLLPRRRAGRRVG